MTIENLSTYFLGRNENSPGAEDSRDAMEMTRDSIESGVDKLEIDPTLRQELLDLGAENKRLEAMIVQLASEKSSLSTKVELLN